MSGLEQVAVLAAGLVAGMLTSTVGVASLASFPVLIGIGLPPVTANASNTVGLLPGALSGSLGYRAELREHPRVTVAVLLTSGIGAVAGAVLLLALPPGVFEAVVPWLILGTCLLVGFQPRIASWLRRRAGTDGDGDEPAQRTSMSPTTTGFAMLTGVYGGYFGAAQGVLLMGVLGIGVEETMQRLNGVKNVLAAIVNGVAGVIFAVVAPIDWWLVLVIGVGALIGGTLGASVGRRLPSGVLRAVIVVVGVLALVMFLVR